MPRSPTAPGYLRETGAAGEQQVGRGRWSGESTVDPASLLVKAALLAAPGASGGTRGHASGEAAPPEDWLLRLRAAWVPCDT